MCQQGSVGISRPARFPSGWSFNGLNGFLNVPMVYFVIRSPDMGFRCKKMLHIQFLQLKHFRNAEESLIFPRRFSVVNKKC